MQFFLKSYDFKNICFGKYRRVGYTEISMRTEEQNKTSASAKMTELKQKQHFRRLNYNFFAWCLLVNLI